VLILAIVNLNEKVLYDLDANQKEAYLKPEWKFEKNDFSNFTIHNNSENDFCIVYCCKKYGMPP
jgi:hypothetical protein